MSYLHLTRRKSTSRSRSPSFRLLTRHDTKRSRIITLSDDDDDDGADDYPYSTSHRPVRPSRALTLRNAPSQLERLNIWSDRHASASPARDDESAAFDRERELERTKVYKYSSSRHQRHRDVEEALECDPEERDFRLRVRATLSRPRHHHHHCRESFLAPVTDSMRGKEKVVDKEWETCERSRSRERARGRRDSFWGDGRFWGDKAKWERESEDEKDVWRRYRRIKRTKTEEWKPLTGWRRI